MSIVVSWDTEKMEDICSGLHIAPYTIALSPGIKGRKDKLPSRDFMRNSAG
jgi:hypothetical protein